MELSHSQAVIRLKDIQTELERLGEKPDDKLTAEDEQSFDELTREFAEVDFTAASWSASLRWSGSGRRPRRPTAVRPP